MLLDCGCRHAGGGKSLAQPFGVVGQHDIGGVGLEEGSVMARTACLFAVRQRQRAVEGIGMRPRLDGQRREPLSVAIGKRPGDAAAPIMAHEVKALIAIARCGDDRHRIIHQPVHVIVGRIARIGPRGRRIAALARRDRAIAHVRKRRDLRPPAMEGLGKAMQQQHQRRTALARDEGVEGEIGGDGDFVHARHASNTTPVSVPN